MDLHLIFDFLKQLRENNNRDWFNANKAAFLSAKSLHEEFIKSVIPLVKEIDPDINITEPKDCIFRIYRDTRFSKDPAPYKTNFGAYINRNGKKSPYAGFYLHMEPGTSFIAGGVYQPDPKSLKAIRTEILYHSEEYKSIINNGTFTKFYNEYEGERLKTAPKGFPKDFADVDLIKPKHYAYSHFVSDDFWSNPDLLQNLKEAFQALYPLNQFINRAIDDIV